MRYNVTVDVPYAKKLSYTLFAKGSLIETPHVDDNGDFVHFKFEGKTVFVLFYTFSGFRRAYIVTCWQDKKDGEAITLPGINEKLCLIFTARGRKVDDLKRVIYILTDEQDDDKRGDRQHDRAEQRHMVAQRIHNAVGVKAAGIPV